MGKIHIEKTTETIKKEEMKAKIKALKVRKNVTNDELKELLLIILQKLEGEN
jgi:hypothetical protein